MKRTLQLAPGLALLAGLVAVGAQAQDNPLDRPPPRSGNPLDPDPAWAGLWVDEEAGVGLVVLPAEGGPEGQVEGLLVIRREDEDGRRPEREYELTGAAAGDVLEGTFGTRDGPRFPFKVRPAGGRALTLESGRSTYTLRRVQRSTGALRRELRERRERAPGTPGGNEASAIGCLKTLTTAQVLFREGDKEGDGTLDYGTLEELRATQLIDDVLGGGRKAGYAFTCLPSESTPEFLWMATADPLQPGVTGTRYFMVNQAGVIYYSTRQAFTFDDACGVPEWATPLGQPEGPPPSPRPERPTPERPGPTVRPAPARAPNLGHVRAGQRWVYAMQNDMTMEWTVRSVGEVRVGYETSIIMGGNRLGDPTPAEWVFSPAVPGADPAQQPGVTTRRERLTVAGLEFDCLVVSANGYTTWVPMDGDAPVFPGVIKTLDANGTAVMELKEVR